MKEKKKKGGVLIWFVLLIVFIAIGYFAKMNMPKFGHSETIDVSTLKSEIVVIKELATIQEDYRATINKEKDGLISKRYYATFDGTIKAGIDMEKVDIEVSETDEDSSDPVTITVTMPKAKVLSHEDSNWNVVYEAGYGNIGAERNEIIMNEKKRIQEEFEKSGRLEEAEEKAKEVITNFIKTTCGEDVVVVFAS